jgi:hypothetical protein
MARKKFKAQSIKGKGLLSSTHTVRTASGGTMTVQAQPASVKKGERNYEIADAKRRILNRLPTQDGKVRTLMLDGIKRADAVFGRYDSKRNRTTGELRPPDKTALARELEQVVRGTVRGARDQILENLEGSVKTYLIGVRRSLPNRDRLPMSTINQIARRKALQVYNQPTGKSGMNTAQRLGGVGAKMEAELTKLIDSGLLKRIEKRPSLKKSLVDPKGSNKSCVAKSITRINRTEQNRAMQSATIEVMRSIGINLFYWRLSASHKDYGGTEICEVLSVSTGADVSGILPNDFSGSLSGLYSDSSVPDLPHPNCMCSLEPLVV